MNNFFYDKDLAALFEASVDRAKKYSNHLLEKEKQDVIAQDLDAKKSDSEPSSSDDKVKQKDNGAEKATKEKIDNPEKEDKLKNADIEIDDVIEQINTLRSGKSLKNADVYQNFESYFNALDKAEKTALFSFLQGLVEIIVGDKPGEQALDPSDAPADVDMEKKLPQEKQTFHVKPNIIKKDSVKKQHHEQGVEDTSAPISMPVKPKK